MYSDHPFFPRDNVTYNLKIVWFPIHLSYLICSVKNQAVYQEKLSEAVHHSIKEY